MSEWNEEYKTKVRNFMERCGRPVEFADTSWNGNPEPSTYGWVDYDADNHCRRPTPRYPHSGGGCHWVVPSGAILTEKTYSQFADTMTDNKHEVGCNVTGCRCACGQYTDITLRWTGTVTEMLHDILGINKELSITL